MTESENKALYIGEQCRKAGLTLAGAAGVIANVEAESAFKETNLQDTYERSLGMSDRSYTDAVDCGSYQDFTRDAAGYGLAQWTAAERKAKMLVFFKQRGVSIGDFRTQVDYLLHEMRGYTRAWETCTSSNEAYECGYAVCRYYEIPADTEAQARQRGYRATNWYTFLANAMNTGAESSISENGSSGDQGAAESGKSGSESGNTQELDEDGLPIPKTWPPRTIDTNCTGWPEVKLLQALLLCHGYNVLIDGIYGEALRRKVALFQDAYDLGNDGIVGPKTWAALMEWGDSDGEF